MHDLSSSARTGSIPTSTITTIGEETVLPGSTTTGFLTFPNSSDWAFAGDFCVEIFGLKIANAAIRHGIISFYNASGNQRSWGLDYRGDLSPKRFSLNLSSDGSAITTIEANTTLTANTAYNICFERTGTTVRIYQDGTVVNSGTHSGALFASNQLLDIGMGIAQTSGAWTGRFKAIRITKASRYGGAYTPPSLPLPTSA